MIRLRLIGALVTVLLTAPSLGNAQPKPNEDKAREHYNQAEMYMKAEVYDKAVDEYLKGYEYAPDAHAFLFNVGLAYQKLEERPKALMYYEKYLERDPQGIKSAEARARAEALRRAIQRDTRGQPEQPGDDGGAGGSTSEPNIGTDPFGPSSGRGTPITNGPVDAPKKSKLGWILAGSALIAAGLAADLLPGSGKNGEFDAMDLLPLGLYGVGGVFVIRGVF